MNPLQSWQDAAKGLLNLVFPARCVVCGLSDTWLCAACRGKVEFIQPPICPVCGQPSALSRLCPSCRAVPPQIDGIRAVGYLDGTLRTAIHRFKYTNVRPLAAPLGQLMAAYLSHNQLPVDVIVPVPLHSNRLRERGYNQAELLARQIEHALGLPLLTKSLLRVKSTAPQVGLSARRRRSNVRGAFHCSDDTPKGQRVLLIDDVCTTGATLEACSLALQQRGTRAVWGLVLARERWQQTGR